MNDHAEPMRRKRTRARGLAAWKPRAESLALLNDVRAVLAEYRDHLPMTLRQAFYRLVSRGFPKDERAYSRLGDMLNRARRAGLIPWHTIRDDGGQWTGGGGWESAAQWLRATRGSAERFRLDRQLGQPVRLVLLCEAAGMAPMLADAAEPYSVPVLGSGGFDSVTMKRSLADRLARHPRAIVLHVGDHDPSGTHLFASLAEDVAAIMRGLGHQPADFHRLAVTPEQVAAFNLPTAPPKPTDRRSFTGETVQAEAIPPDALARLVVEAIEARQDATIRAALLDREAEERARLVRHLDRLGDEGADA